MKDRRTFLKATTLLATISGIFGYKTLQAKNRITIMENSKGMMQHQVYFWLKSTVTESDRKAFEKGLHNLISNIKEVSKAEIGVPAKTADRDVVDHSFAYSLLVRFKTIEDHNIYQSHAAHQKFIDDHAALWEKVKVYDSEMII